MAGSGPDGRIVAVDIPVHAKVTAVVPRDGQVSPRVSTIAMSAEVSLAGFYRIADDAGHVGLDIAIEDAAFRAAKVAILDRAGGVAIEADGRQIMIGSGSDLSIGAERRRRQDALDRGEDVSAQPAVASLLVMHSARAVPTAMPLLPGRAVRIVLVVDRKRERASVLLSVDGEVVTEACAGAMLEAFADALEQPLSLLV